MEPTPRSALKSLPRSSPLATPTPRSTLKTLPRSSPLATQVLLERNQLSRENASLREVLHEKAPAGADELGAAQRSA